MEKHMIDDSIEPVWRSEWHPSFNCEAREWLGECAGEFYFAFEISPAHDEQRLDWSGPYVTRAEAHAKLKKVFESWEQRDGEIWQAWEDRQIAEFDRP
jgi:hypothetical protein